MPPRLNGSKVLELEVDSDVNAVETSATKRQRRGVSNVHAAVDARLHGCGHTSARGSIQSNARSFLRDAFERHDWKVFPTGQISHAKIEASATPAVDLCSRSRTRRSSRPVPSRLRSAAPA